MAYLMDSVTRLEAHPKVRIASNGSWLESKPDDGSAGEDD